MAKFNHEIYKNALIMNSVFRIRYFSLILLLLLAGLIGILSVWDIPLYSDSAFHGSVIRDIVETGRFPIYSPVGWVAQDTHPMSYEPFLTHPPEFYLLGANLSILGISLVTVLSIAAILPFVICTYYFFRLVKAYFGNSAAYIASVLFVFMPMNVWLLSHRLMEPLQYMLSISALFYLKIFLDKQKYSYLVLAGLFLVTILYIKITSLFIVLAAVLFFNSQ